VRLAVLDCRGHGESPAGDPQSFSIGCFADDVAAAIAAVADGPVIAGGISMGAAIAMRLACTRPELIKGLVIARPAWTFASSPPNMAPNLEVGRILMQPPKQGEVEEFLASATGRRLAAEAPDNLASLTGFFRRQPRAVTAELLMRISRDGPGVTQSQLAALALPTLVIGHEQDVIHPMSFAREIAGAVSGARLVEIPPKARGVMVYQEAFRTALARFIKETV
jgi:pimeloyl-ACP methyl ester carboxylesterase